MKKWYNRFYEQELPRLLKAGKVLLVYGAGRAGNTSLILKGTSHAQEFLLLLTKFFARD